MVRASRDGLAFARRVTAYRSGMHTVSARNTPKMAGEPKRVQPSKSRADTVGNAPPVGQGLPDLT